MKDNEYHEANFATFVSKTLITSRKHLNHDTTMPSDNLMFKVIKGFTSFKQ